jgi:hypothetical protein
MFLREGERLREGVVHKVLPKRIVDRYLRTTPRRARIGRLGRFLPWRLGLDGSAESALLAGVREELAGVTLVYVESFSKSAKSFDENAQSRQKGPRY